MSLLNINITSRDPSFFIQLLQIEERYKGTLSIN